MRFYSRNDIGTSLKGEILELGPGNAPFPLGCGANVKYVDRKVEGGRDLNWPELIGAPHGPQADFDINIDIHGLNIFPNGAFDVVIASHIIEHLANPLQVLKEINRVLKPDGKVILMMPDRNLTFDSIRNPTTFSHIFEEYKNSISEVSEDHIIEFCSSIYSQPPMHPDQVREWHNPQNINPEIIELHKRRSIHVHCWSPEEFASLITCSIHEDITSWYLENVYSSVSNHEFGLVLRKPSMDINSNEMALRFAKDWTNATLDYSDGGVHEVFKFQNSLHRDIKPQSKGVQQFMNISSSILTERILVFREEIKNLRKELNPNQKINVFKNYFKRFKFF